MLAKDIPLLYR